jgi:inorganic triphosphatase YgiF
MTDDDIPSLAEAMAEIRRLRAHTDLLELNNQSLHEAMAEIRRLREELELLKSLMRKSTEIWRTENERCYARVAELETHAAMTLGTLAQPTEDAPATITHGHAPSAPPHDE